MRLRTTMAETAIELQWLEQAWDHGNWFQSEVVPASQGSILYLYTPL